MKILARIYNETAIIQLEVEHKVIACIHDKVIDLFKYLYTDEWVIQTAQGDFLYIDLIQKGD